jgi:hypothetical protein
VVGCGPERLGPGPGSDRRRSTPFPTGGVPRGCRCCPIHSVVGTLPVRYGDAAARLRQERGREPCRRDPRFHEGDGRRKVGREPDGRCRGGQEALSFET